MKQLLRLYPRAWRARYEDEFLALLEESTPSPFDAFDIMLGALDAHLRPQVSVDKVKSERRSLMNGTKFARWSGLAGALGGILLVLGFIGASMVSDDEYPYAYGLGDILMNLLVSVSLLLMLAGLVGLYAKWSARTGIFGRVSLGITGIGLLTLLTGALLQLWEILRWPYSFDGWWNILMIGLMLLLLGTSLFSAAALRARILPILGGVICLVGGIGTLATMLISTGLVNFDGTLLATGDENIMATAMGVLSLTFIAGWVSMSYTLWTNKATTTAQPEPNIT